jgi:cytochrome c oxidase subunit 2
MKSQLYVQTEEEYEQWVQQNTIAQSDSVGSTLAANPASSSDSEFLAPLAAEIGVEADTIAQLQSLHHHPINAEL